jgi:short-subunit dehydrogenase
MNNRIYVGHRGLITGASSGIGEAFARALAARGMHLVLVARSEARLQALADELARQHPIGVDVIAADLSQAGAAQRVRSEVGRRGLDVDLLVNNAGFGTHGAFATLDAERDRREIMVDVVAVVDIAHAFVPAMLERGGGAVINVASTGAFQPLPSMAVYGASKAFVLSFSQALAEEVRGRGVRVLALCPGPTETPFFDDPGEGAGVGFRRRPDQVVATGLRALQAGRTVVVDGAVNTLLAEASRLLPRRLTTRIAGRALGWRGSAVA